MTGRDDLDDLQRDARRLVALQIDKARALAHRAFVKVALAVLAGVFALAVLVTGAVHFVLGLVGAIASVTNPWAGSLLGGLACLGLFFGALSWHRRAWNRRFVRRLQAERVAPDASSDSAADVSSGPTAAASAA